MIKKIAALSGTILMLATQQSLALPVQVEVPYAVAIPTTYEVLPNSAVTVPLRITNTGANNLVFDCNTTRALSGGPDCIGYRPRMGILGSWALWEGEVREPVDWDITEGAYSVGPGPSETDQFDQFNFTLTPGEAADLVFARFVAGSFGQAVNAANVSIQEIATDYTVHFPTMLRVTVGDQNLTGPFVTLPATRYLPDPIPEPGTMLLMTLGGLMVAGMAATRRHLPGQTG